MVDYCINDDFRRRHEICCAVISLFGCFICPNTGIGFDEGIAVQPQILLSDYGGRHRSRTV